MWLCARQGTGREATRLEIDQETVDRLTRWYSGHGDRGDELRSIALVRLARRKGQWIACDCLGDQTAPPLLAPACLSVSRTWYLRRLTGPSRPRHRNNCPFAVEQETVPSTTTQLPDVELSHWFRAIEPPPRHMAKRAATASAAANRTASLTPHLGRLCHLMMQRAGLTRLTLWDRANHGIARQFEALYQANCALMIAPERPLGDLLFSHQRDLVSGAVQRELTRRFDNWPRGHAPQAFVLAYARGIDQNRILTADGPITIGVKHAQSGDEPAVTYRGSILSPSLIPRPGGPWLCLIVVGRPPEGGMVQPLKAWAEPILSGRAFFPVRTDFERTILWTLLSAAPAMAARGTQVEAFRPLFGKDPLAAGLQFEIVDHATGEVRHLSVNTIGAGLEDMSGGRTTLREDLADAKSLRKRLWRQLMPPRFMSSIGDGPSMPLRPQEDRGEVRDRHKRRSRHARCDGAQGPPAGSGHT